MDFKVHISNPAAVLGYLRQVVTVYDSSALVPRH